jgi:hypothetical protein
MLACTSGRRHNSRATGVSDCAGLMTNERWTSCYGWSMLDCWPRVSRRRMERRSQAAGGVGRSAQPSCCHSRCCKVMRRGNRSAQCSANPSGHPDNRQARVAARENDKRWIGRIKTGHATSKTTMRRTTEKSFRVGWLAIRNGGCSISCCRP